MPPFETTEHTADIGIKATGKNLSKALSDLALGMFSIITCVDKIEVKECFEIEVGAGDLETLVFNWLDELLYQHQTNNFLFKDFLIKEANEKSIISRCCGEKYDEQKHAAKSEIKAVTFYGLKVKKDDRVQINVTFDI